MVLRNTSRAASVLRVHNSRMARAPWIGEIKGQNAGWRGNQKGASRHLNGGLGAWNKAGLAKIRAF